MATMMAIIDPGDEVVIFEPFYENYGPDAILSGATPRYVTLHAPDLRPAGALRADWSFDPDELAAAFNDKTKAIIINTPNNPTGKVFTRDELEMIAALCRKWDAIAISDEIYEHIIYDGRRHVPIATIEGMADRTVTHQRPVEDLQRDRLAGRLDDLAAVADRRDPQGARLPDGRGGGAAAGGGRRRARPARRLLREARRQLPAAPRRAARHPRAPSLHLLQAARRVLHHDRHQRVRLRRRRRVRAVSGEGRRRGGGAGQQLLQDAEPAARSCGSVSASATRRCRRPTAGCRNSCLPV